MLNGSTVQMNEQQNNIPVTDLARSRYQAMLMLVGTTTEYILNHILTVPAFDQEKGVTVIVEHTDTPYCQKNLPEYLKPPIREKGSQNSAGICEDSSAVV